jgi:hypothetical protein
LKNGCQKNFIKKILDLSALNTYTINYEKIHTTWFGWRA